VAVETCCRFVKALDIKLNKITLVTLFVMLLWAVCYPLITLSLAFSPPMLTAFFRAAISGFLLIFVAMLLKRPLPHSFKQWMFITFIGFTATSIGFWGMFYASTLVSPGLATVLTNTQPLIAAIIGWYVLKEKLNRNTILAISLGFVGVLIISNSSDTLVTNDDMMIGFLYILSASIGIAVSNVLLKIMANKVDVFYAMGIQLLIGAIPLGLISFHQSDFLLLNWNYSYTWLVMALAILGTALPFILWFWLMDKAPLYQLNIYSFLSPVFGLSIGFVYFSEKLTSVQWVGVVLIGSAIFIVSKLNHTDYSMKNQNNKTT
jgi:drug/metabolite transporter (DMT)-like permease